MKLAAAAVLAAVVLAAAAAVAAHPLDPALLELRQLAGGRVDVSFQAPLGSSLAPLLPASCAEVMPRARTTTPRSVRSRWQIDCGAESLVGVRLGVQGLAAQQTDALVRIAFLDGRSQEQVLRADTPFMTIAAPAGSAGVLREHLRLGFLHVLDTPEPLLLVLALVLLVRHRRRLLWAIAAFTVGHSATLSLATLGLIRVPPAPVEVLLALSLVVVAVELTRIRSSGTWLAAIALGFGLLHGLGFAAALAQTALPANDVPRALLGFNLGIELGLLLFVAVALAAIALLRSLPIRWPRATRLLPAYAIGSLAALWFFERLTASF